MTTQEMTKQKKDSDIRKTRGRKPPKNIWRTLFKTAIVLFLLVLLAGSGAGFVYYNYLQEELPQITTLQDYNPPIITTVFSDDGRKIAEFYRERRVVVPLSKIPEQLIKAFVAAEDARFYVHQGIDIVSVIRAFFKNIEAGTIVQGGSTITQQVTKSFLLTPERSYSRKIKEAILSYRIDKRFSKEDILFLYLNQIYLGHGAYGVQAAAENYFGKSVTDLNLAECAILAGLPQAPSKYSPFQYPDRARKRQIYVLNRMVTEGYITNIQATEAMNTPLDIKPRRNWYIEKVPYYTEFARQYVEKKYGLNALYTGGLQIHTAVNIDMQKIAQEEIIKGLRDLDKRMGYRGPIKHLEPAEIEPFIQELAEKTILEPLAPDRIVTAVVVNVDDALNMVTVRVGGKKGRIPIEEMAWATKPNPERAYYERRLRKPSDALRAGDVILVRLKEKNENEEIWECTLEQDLEVQSALLCLEAETGLVKAMVGGTDFRDTQFNRAIQSRRQPGSSFKPIIYAAALDRGYTPATVIMDTPIVFHNTERNFTWKPKNYEEKFFGPTLFRTALEKSHNVVTIKILKDIGVGYAISYARKLGVVSPLSHDLSIALGSSGLSLLELVNAYAVFANLGYLVEPVFITRIVDRNGTVLEEAVPTRKKVINSNTAYIMTNLMEGVVKRGTGRRVLALNRPVAGKTGTTNNLNDAWFIGYTPRYVTGTWVGFDNTHSMGKGETGSRAASPIWLGFMQRVLEDKPVQVFQVPEGVVFSKIDADTGKLPVPESAHTIFECFKEGTEPTEYSERPNKATQNEDLFKMDM